MEQGTPLTCEQCQTEFTPKNRNGVQSRFCSVRCKDRRRNGQRLKGAALLMDKKPFLRRGPSKQTQAVSQQVFMLLVPVEERAELIRQAAQNLGITQPGQIAAAMRRAQVPYYEGTV